MSETAHADGRLLAAADWIESYLARQRSSASDATVSRMVLASKTGYQSLEVSSLALRLFGEVLRALGEGCFVRVESLPAELTLKAAADALQIPRAVLVQLVDRGDIPHTGFGRARRISLVDLMSYQDARNTQSRTALAELADQAQELGMGYAGGDHWEG